MLYYGDSIFLFRGGAGSKFPGAGRSGAVLKIFGSGAAIFPGAGAGRASLLHYSFTHFCCKSANVAKYTLFGVIFWPQKLRPRNFI